MITIDRMGTSCPINGAVLAAVAFGLLLVGGGCASGDESQQGSDDLYEATHFTEPESFPSGAEGPAVDEEGNVYAVNYLREGTIGKVSTDGEASVFVELSNGSIGNGIRFNSNGDMMIADYVNHNILKVGMDNQEVEVYASNADMNQPNDIAIDSDDRIYASDPDWENSTGQLWRIDRGGETVLLEDEMGTTNGIEVSPDEQTLYVNESEQRNIWAYDLSEDGEISNKSLFYEFSEYGLDGMRCDVEGNLYVTRHGKGVVVKLSPEGELLREIEMVEGENTTNLAFGGADGRTVYVTVADVGNIQSFRVDEPGRAWSMFEN